MDFFEFDFVMLAVSRAGMFLCDFLIIAGLMGFCVKTGENLSHEMVIQSKDLGTRHILTGS